MLNTTLALEIQDYNQRPEGESTRLLPNTHQDWCIRLHNHFERYPRTYAGLNGLLYGFCFGIAFRSLFK